MLVEEEFTCYNVGPCAMIARDDDAIDDDGGVGERRLSSGCRVLSQHIGRPDQQNEEDAAKTIHNFRFGVVGNKECR